MISPHIFKTKKHIIFCNFDYQKFVNIFGNIVIIFSVKE